MSSSLTRNRTSFLLHIIHGHHHHHHRQTKYLSEVNSIYVRREVIRVIGENLCPALTDLNSSTVPFCPSYDVLEYDENRTPPIMRQVKCTCNACLGPLTDGEKRCQPIYTYELVLRVVGCDKTNHYEYAQVWEPKSIGCECRSLTESEHRDNNYVMPP